MVQCEQPAPSTSNSATGCGIMKHLCSKSSHQTSDVDSGTISTASHHPAWWLDDLSLYARAWYVLPCPMAYIRCECSHLTHYAIANGIYQKLGESWVSHPYMPCDMVWMSATPLWYHVGIHSLLNGKIELLSSKSSWYSYSKLCMEGSTTLYYKI